MKQEEIQQLGLSSWENNGCNGTLEMCTGSGKSKIGVLAHAKYPGKNLLLVPTEVLRDVDWRKEFEKWGYDFNIEAMCYASAYKLKDQEYNLVIADEIHNSLSEELIKFYQNNKCNKILGLSATISKQEHKKLEEINAEVVYKYTLTQAINDKVVSPYYVTINLHTLDNVTKNIKAGSKVKGFFQQSERKAYDYLSKQIMQLRIAGKYDVERMVILKRMRLLYDLPSKLLIAKKILKRLQSEGKRVVIFGESITSLDLLTEYAIHSKKTKKQNDQIYTDFNNQTINEIASAKKIKEGVNLTNVDALLIYSFNSKLRDIIQRIGRSIRFREEHIAEIIIIVTKDTQEENWIEYLEKGGLDLRNPTYIPSNRL